MRTEIIMVRSAGAPTVEIDTSVSAVYVRFKKSKVVRTVSEDRPGIVTAIDFDASNDVVGVEFIGVKEFGIAKLLSLVPIRVPKIDLSRVRYVPASRCLVPA